MLQVSSQVTQVQPHILYTMRGSIYNDFPVECWDASRDATKYPGPFPVVAHPPCGKWGRLYRISKKPSCERLLAICAVFDVRTFGGVLEHPSSSKLWAACNLPIPGCSPDSYGGYSLDVNQHWFGHRAAKRTWLYIVGCSQRSLPPIPYNLNAVTHTIGQWSGHKGKCRKEVNKRENSATPIAFASWLIEVAARCKVPVRL